MRQRNVKISEFDKNCYKIIRDNIERLMKESAAKYDQEGALILDVAPQIHKDASYYFNSATVKTLDIDPTSNADYIADITKYNNNLEDEMFDIIVCTEVLEHTLNPFYAIEEIYRILKEKGVLILSVPFNFRIHGPLPDCWRFSEYGLKELLKNFCQIEINSVETPGRNLMPIHYTVRAHK